MPILGVVRPGASAAALSTRSRHVGVIATVRRPSGSHAYFEAIKDENPFVEVYEHATPELVPLVEAGRLDGPEVEEPCDARWRRCWASVTPAASSIFPLPASERIDTLLLGCTHYPLLAADHRRRSPGQRSR